MTETTYADFGYDTEGLQVAQAFEDQIRGRTVVVTGVNRGGIGFSTAEAFASRSPAYLIVAGRSSSKLQDSIEALRAQYPNVIYRLLQIDLSKQQSVRNAASQLLEWADVAKVDILVNSAGVALLPERTLSEDGIEMHFATNHIGHFLFTSLIMPKILQAAKENRKGATRIINVSSGSPMWCYMRWSDTNFEIKTRDLPEEEKPNLAIHNAWGSPDAEEMTYIPLEAYNQSKVANLLFSIGANKRLYEKHGILSLTVHPGWIRTELDRSVAPGLKHAIQNVAENEGIQYKTLKGGCSTSLVAALDLKLGMASLEAPIAGYAVEAVQWEVEVSPGRFEVLSGTVQEVYAEILSINPEFKLAPAPETVADKPADITALAVICGNWPSANKGRIEEGVRYLHGVGGRPLAHSGPGICGRVSCSHNAAIWWCNDNNHPIELGSFGAIANSAQHLVNVCASAASFVSGQNFEAGNWNTIVRGDSC
ncbi:oxidoreductase [Paramyrothecium foliicola]|nr:oxidoreductase [Paramyrothecium foliicola]